jgi:hypothetical protein
MKKCSKCKIEKDLGEFGISRSRKDGLNYWCKECSKIYSRENDTCKALRSRIRNDRVVAENQENLLLYLIDNPCVECGETDVRCLHFDHIVSEEKHRNISSMMSYNWNTIQKEIDKCRVLCANCHCKRTSTQQGWYKEGL